MYGALGASGCGSAAQKGFRGVSCDHQTEIGVFMDRSMTRVIGAVVATVALQVLGVAGVTSGIQLWAKRYNGPGNGTDIAHSVAVSPSGATVSITGKASRPPPGQLRHRRSHLDHGTVGYKS